MNIIARGLAFFQYLVSLSQRSNWDWRRCPKCGGTDTCKWGRYARHPWFLTGRQQVWVQRHRCNACGRTYSEQSALLIRGSWYAREVHRSALDHWQHLGTSLRRTAAVLRSWMGHQERWLLWRPLDGERGERCHLAASTVHRWLDGAGQTAQASVDGQLCGMAQTRVVGTDGLWAKLKGQAQRVVLLVVDSVSGLVYPPVVAQGEESAGPWQRLFERAKRAGLDWDALRGVTSDGAQGLLAYLRRNLAWVQQQRCVWHLWRNFGGELAKAASKAAEGLTGEAAEQARQQVRDELGSLIHQIIDAKSYDQAEAALATLLGHPLGATIGKLLNEQLDRVLVHLLDYYRGLPRVTPEWYWRDFRHRLSHGRNHRSDQRLERAALVWATIGSANRPQFRARSVEVRAQTSLSPPRPECPRSCRSATRTSQLPGRFGRVSAHGTAARYPKPATGGPKRSASRAQPRIANQHSLPFTNRR